MWNSAFIFYVSSAGSELRRAGIRAPLPVTPADSRTAGSWSDPTERESEGGDNSNGKKSMLFPWRRWVPLRSCWARQQLWIYFGLLEDGSTGLMAVRHSYLDRGTFTSPIFPFISSLTRPSCWSFSDVRVITRSASSAAHQKVCVVGGGPAGFYTAQHLLKASTIH